MEIDINVIKDLWSKTYNTHGSPDWSHIFPFYSDNILFQDTIQKIEGKELFVEMCNRLATRCKELNMEIKDISQSDNKIFFEWIMTMKFKKYPSTPLYGCTKLTLSDDLTKIEEQRDFYDLWGDIFNKIPHFGKWYRNFIKKKFG